MADKIMNAAERKVSEEIRAVVESDAMDDVADYLNKGRRFAGLDETNLKDLWVSAFKAFVRKEEPVALGELIDANAELTVRRLEPPLDSVKAERELMMKDKPQIRAVAKIIVAELQRLQRGPKSNYH